MSDLPARYRRTLEVMVRVRWLPAIVVVLCLTAILWILLSPSSWQAPLVFIGAAIPLAILGKESDR